MEDLSRTVQLDKRAGIVVLYLNHESRNSFVAAVRNSDSLRNVAEPFLSWLLDVRSIPIEARKTRFERGRHHPIEIDENPTDFLLSVSSGARDEDLSKASTEARPLGDLFDVVYDLNGQPIIGPSVMD